MQHVDSRSAILAVLCASALCAAQTPAQPSPPPPPPADAPLVTPAPSPPPGPAEAQPAPEAGASAHLQEQDPLNLQVQYPEPAGATVLSILIGVPLTWLAATAPAFVLGMLGWGGTLALTRENSSNLGLGSLAVGFGIGAVGGIAITYGLLPALVTAFGNDSQYVGNAQEARAEGWRRGKYALVAMYVGLAIAAGGGFILSGNSANAGANALSTAGWIIAGVSYVVAWVLDVSGVIAGYEASRRPKRFEPEEPERPLGPAFPPPNNP